MFARDSIQPELIQFMEGNDDLESGERNRVEKESE